MALSQRRRSLLKRLATKKGRSREELVLVEGIRAVGEALEAGAAMELAVVAPRLRALEGGAALEARLSAVGAPLEKVSDAEIGPLSDTEHPQGVVVVCREPRATEDVRPDGRYLVLDAVQDPGNVGTLVRAAVAFGLDGVIALDGTADPWGTKAVRASTGLVFRSPPWRTHADGAVSAFREAGVPVIVADASGVPVAGRPGRGWALAVGNEGAGVRPSIREVAAATVRIPMPGPAESLNAGVAGAILLYAMTTEVGGA